MSITISKIGESIETALAPRKMATQLVKHTITRVKTQGALPVVPEDTVAMGKAILQKKAGENASPETIERQVRSFLELTVPDIEELVEHDPNLPFYKTGMERIHTQFENAFAE